jgi:hypothetical protein
MKKRFFSSVAFFVFLSLGVQAETSDNLCVNFKNEGICTPIEFTAGLPRDDYESTLLSISKFIEDDFKFYLTESHGPFSKNKTPPIDYEVEFFSAVSKSNIYGVTKFIVISTVTKVKPFGIIVIKTNREVDEIGISFGYSSYAVLEGQDGFYFLFKDRFSSEITSLRID